jgi:SMODS and SLOG-associating 2TM effector domain 1
VSDRTRQFVEVYRASRVENQRDYYVRRAAEFEAAHRQLLLVSSLVFGLSSAVALVAGLDVPGKLVWAILAAVLPAITTALAAFEGLYAFERVAKLYGDAARNLRLVEAPELSGSTDESATVAAYVNQVEAIFVRERGQWGQLMAEEAGEEEQT